MALALWRNITSRNSPATPVRRMGNSPPASTTTLRVQVDGSNGYIDLIRSPLRPQAKFKELLEGLIQNSRDVRAIGEHEMTALHYSVLNNDEQCTKALVVFGADINARNKYDQTPLDIAFENQVEDLVPLLVSIGCKRGKDMKQGSGSPSGLLKSRAEIVKRRADSGISSCSRSRSHSRSPSPPSKRSSRCEEAKFTLSPGASEACLNGSTDDTFGVGVSEACAFGKDGDFLPECPACCTPKPKSSPCSNPKQALHQLLSDEIEQRYDMDESLKPDELLQIAMQQQEMARFRSEEQLQPPEDECDDFGSSVEFKAEGGSRILSLDGGGIRGLVQIEILSEIERLTGKKITDIFDIIIGTSTGGIVALGLVYCNMTLSQLRQLYFRLREEIFANSRMGVAYDTNALEDILKNEMGTELKMSDVQHPKVLISAVDKSTTQLRLRFFNNVFNDEYSKQHIWQVARYTTAAPMHFTECDNYVDGGMLANNPCESGLMRIQRFYRLQGRRLPITCVVSMGSGISPAEELGSTSIPIGFNMLRVIHTVRRTQNFMTLLANAIVESEAVAEKCRGFCDEQRIPFFRFSPHFDEKIESGETDSLKLISMVIKAKICTNEDQQMDKLVSLLCSRNLRNHTSPLRYM